MFNWNNIAISLSLGYLCYKYQTYTRDKGIKHKYFENKNIIITGASSGIGKSLYEILKQNNCKLFLLARSLDTNENKNICTYKCDCSDYQQVTNTITQINLKTNNNIDIVIHCAGAGDWKFLNEMNIDEINKCLDAPLKSSINITHKILPDLIKNNKGQIVFVQSPVILQPWSSCTAYSISRWGMKGLAESLRADLYNTNINISEIILGRTDSNYFKTNKSADERFPKIGHLVGTITPNQAAFAILWAVQNKKEYYYYPFMMKIVIYLQYVFPNIVRYLTFKTSWYL